VPKPSFLPLLLAIAVGFSIIGILVNIVLVPIGAVFAFLVIAAWTWPRKEEVVDL
jgi:hypothetical protein